MKTKNYLSNTSKKASIYAKTAKRITIFIAIFLFSLNQVFAHCDSWDGPVVKDAIKALETNNVKLVFKWINKDQEDEIASLFDKTYSLKNKDQEIYKIVEKHFFETLVRLHRETEGAPFTGLKPAGNIKPIIQMSDKAVIANDINSLTTKLNNHILKTINEKFQKVLELSIVKDESVEKGREYVKAYIDYTHTIEAIHDVLEHGAEHNHKE